MPEAPPQPREIAAALEQRVVGQGEAVRELSLALAKKLAGLASGNVLMIGASGTGKTTLMRAVEEYLASDPWRSSRSTLVRFHANVLADEAGGGRSGEEVLLRLLARARERAEGAADAGELLRRVSHGIVFVDEIDKIRSRIEGQPHLPGIRAQEALLTLMENESVPLDLPDWAGGGSVTVDAAGLLFVCAGAFEGLYDAVYDRVTLGADRGALQAVTVVEEGTVRQETKFRLREWLRPGDLFEYGMSPQFLSRFDARVLLDDLGEDALLRIFLSSPDSGLQQSRAYFASHGLDLAISPAAARRIAVEAARQPRLGARALKEVFRRVVRSYEYGLGEGILSGAVAIDLPEVEAALVR